MPKTRQPIASFCVNLDLGQSQCTENGAITFAAVGPGARRVSVNAPSGYDSVDVSATVASGQSKTLVVDLAPLATVNTVILDATTGQPVQNACLELIAPTTGNPGYLEGIQITVRNAVTGDLLGSGDAKRDGTYSVQVFGPQVVTLDYVGSAFDVNYQGFYKNSPDPQHATPVIIPATGTKTVNVVATLARP
jgi:hypothetical protein